MTPETGDHSESFKTREGSLNVQQQKFRQQDRKLGLGQSYQMEVPSNQAPKNAIGSMGRKGEKMILCSLYLQEKGQELQTKARFLIFKFNTKYFMNHPRKHAKPVPFLSKGALLSISLSCEHSDPAKLQRRTKGRTLSIAHPQAFSFQGPTSVFIMVITRLPSASSLLELCSGMSS